MEMFPSPTPIATMGILRIDEPLFLQAALFTYRVHAVLGFPRRIPSDEAFYRLCTSLPQMLSLTVYDGPNQACLDIGNSQLCCLEGCTQLTRLDLRQASSLVVFNPLHPSAGIQAQGRLQAFQHSHIDE